MKIAHLILAHKNPAQLAFLLEALAHGDSGFFIHIDKKSDIEPFKHFLTQPDVIFIGERTDVRWGGWGTIQATMNGLTEICGQDYDYINVISGQDFPIKSAAYIHNYLELHAGKEFISCGAFDGDWNDAASRVEEYHLINWNIPGKFRLGKLMTRLLPRRRFPMPFPIVGRSNWFTISRQAAAYALDFINRHPEMVRYFKYCWGADEMIFSTILYHSPFQDRIQNNLIYNDWQSGETGHPRLLGNQDHSRLRNSEKLFARKFDESRDDGFLRMIGGEVIAGDWDQPMIPEDVSS